MAKTKAVIESTRGNRAISIRLDEELYREYEAVKTLLDKAGLGRLNMTRSLAPAIEEILADARHAAENVLAERSGRETRYAESEARVPAG